MDKGDLDGLAASIDERGGLLQPILVRPDRNNKLVDGERRILAWPRTKFGKRGDPIPIYRLDVDSVLAGERDANEQHKPFTPSEAVAIARELEPELKAAAAARVRTHGGTAPGRIAGDPSAWRGAFAPKHSGQVAQGAAGRRKVTQPESSRTTVHHVAPSASARVGDQLAKATGKSRRTLEKARAIVEAAEREPEKYGRLQADMDKSGRVDGPFKRLQVMQQAEKIRAEPPPLPGNGPYRGIVADVPWPAEPEDDDPVRRSGRGYYPYPTMSIDEIAALPVGSIAADDCVLGLWITNYHLVLGHHLKVLQAWGLQPVTMRTWVKDRWGQGKLMRGQTEHCIYATRGKPVIQGELIPTFFHAAVRTNGRGAHSEKPNKFYDDFERQVPAPRYAELFSRHDRPNWDAHGDEVGKLTRSSSSSNSSAPHHEAEAKAKRVKQKKRANAAELQHAVGEALEAIDLGGAVEDWQIEALAANRLIVGKRSPRLTKAGAARLKSWREEQSHVAQLAALPADVDALVKLYGTVLAELHRAALAGDTRACAAAEQRLDLLQQRANGGTNFGMGTAESPAEQLRAQNAAPIGVAPLWGQRGIWRSDVDGIKCIVSYDGGHVGFFRAHAMDRGAPFISETGFRAFNAPWLDAAEDCPRAPPAQWIAAQIRQHRDNPEHGESGKRKPRKEPLPLPRRVYRLPTSWAERARDMNVAEPVECRGDEQDALPTQVPAQNDDNLDIPPFLRRGAEKAA